MLFQFQVYNIDNCTLSRAHYDKYSYHLSPYDVTTVELSIVPMLCFHPCDLLILKREACTS